MVPVAGIVAYLLLSIEEIGVQMEVIVQLVGCCYSIRGLKEAVHCNARAACWLQTVCWQFHMLLFKAFVASALRVTTLHACHIVQISY